MTRNESGVLGANVAEKTLLETADRALDERLFGAGKVKCLRLQYAFLAFRKAMWAQPMRWFFVGSRLLECVQKIPVGERDKPVTIKVRIAILQFRQFLLGLEQSCIKRVLLLDKRAAALKCFEMRRSVHHDLVLKFKDGVVDLDTLLRVRDSFDKLANCLDGCYRAIERGYDVVRCHGEDYTKNTEKEAQGEK